MIEKKPSVAIQEFRPFHFFLPMFHIFKFLFLFFYFLLMCLVRISSSSIFNISLILAQITFLLKIFSCLLFFYMKWHYLKVCSQVAHLQVIFSTLPTSNRKLSSLRHILKYALHNLSFMKQESPQNSHCSNGKEPRADHTSSMLLMVLRYGVILILSCCKLPTRAISCCCSCAILSHPVLSNSDNTFFTWEKNWNFLYGGKALSEID